MVSFQDIIDFLKPNKVVSFGDLTDNKTLESSDYDLIYLDVTKEYNNFKKYFETSLTKLSDKGVLVVNGAYPRFSAHQSEKRCGKVWYWLSTAGLKYRTFNNGIHGLAVLSKDKENITPIEPDYLQFFNSVSLCGVNDLKEFKKRTRTKKNDKSKQD